MDSIHLSVRGSTDETVELTLGTRPSLRVTALFEELSMDPDPNAVAELITSLKSLRLPAAPSGSLDGIDGFTYTLCITRGRAASEYSWWSEPPSGWKPLARIADQLIALSGRKIPSAGY